MSKWIERKQQLERLDGLIRRRATGNPKELAHRMGMCVRSLTNLMDDLKCMGAEIRYDRNRESYYYGNHVVSDWEVVSIEE